MIAPNVAPRDRRQTQTSDNKKKKVSQQEPALRAAREVNAQGAPAALYSSIDIVGEEALSTLCATCRAEEGSASAPMLTLLR